MKRTFLAKRNALLSAQNISWGALALFFALFLLAVRLFAPNVFWHAVAPVFKMSDALAVETRALMGAFDDATLRIKQNEQLENENAALINERNALLQKIESLSALLGAPAIEKSPGILAGVVARPPVSPYDTLVLAAGRVDGVEVGMEAFGAVGVPVGVVSSVLEDFSRVTLFSAPGMTTGGWVGNANTAITIIGDGGGALRAFVSRFATVAVGDTVYTYGPGMLPVGIVIRVDSDPLLPGSTLRIMPLANPFSIAWVTLRATGITSSPPL